jgi:hypothetical protein
MNTKQYKLLRLAAVVAGVVSTGLAQAAIDEIVVTANKREQSLQDVPVSVSVTSGETIQRAAIVDIIYPKDDIPLLKYTDDDGLLVEPEYYVPIIPMVLVNGMVGIGTGFSTNIPLFNPYLIINNIKRKLNGEKYTIEKSKGSAKKYDQL